MRSFLLDLPITFPCMWHSHITGIVGSAIADDAGDVKMYKTFSRLTAVIAIGMLASTSFAGFSNIAGSREVEINGVPHLSQLTPPTTSSSAGVNELFDVASFETLTGARAAQPSNNIYFSAGLDNSDAEWIVGDEHESELLRTTKQPLGETGPMIIQSSVSPQVISIPPPPAVYTGLATLLGSGVIRAWRNSRRR